MTWKYLLKKEFRQFLRDPGMSRMVMTFPLLIVLVFPFAASMEVRNIRLAVVDNDRSSNRLYLQRHQSQYSFRYDCYLDCYTDIDYKVCIQKNELIECKIKLPCTSIVRGS